VAASILIKNAQVPDGNRNWISSMAIKKHIACP
jgi:hypothetical protein